MPNYVPTLARMRALGFDLLSEYGSTPDAYLKHPRLLWAHRDGLRRVSTSLTGPFCYCSGAGNAADGWVDERTARFESPGDDTGFEHHLRQVWPHLPH
jgi:hypothetical protein